MRQLIRIALLIAGTLTAQAAAAEQPGLAKQRWMLWNDCKGLHLNISLKSNLADEIGLSKERIESSLSDKMRAERIYVTQNLPDGNMIPLLVVKGSVVTKTIKNQENKSVSYGVLAGFWKQFAEQKYFVGTYFDFALGHRINPDLVNRDRGYQVRSSIYRQIPPRECGRLQEFKVTHCRQARKAAALQG